MSASPAHVNGEFVFSLKEKADRNGETYLVAGLPMFNVVMFIRRDEEKGKDGIQRWRGIVKPYRPSSRQGEEEFSWPE